MTDISGDIGGSPGRQSRRGSRTGRIAFYAAVAALLALVIAGPGHRLGLFGALPAVALAAVSTLIAVIAFLLGLVALVMALRAPGRAGLGRAALAVVLGGAIGVQLLGWIAQGRSVPPIHDISTNTTDPPAFVAIAPLRAQAPNPAAYAGAETATAQAKAYPDVEPLLVDAEPAAVVATAAGIAADLGWEVIAQVPGEGRLEATDTTFWFGFKDDIVLRARETAEGSIVDLRSKSRVGRSDLGTNAARIREFSQRLRDALGER